MIGFPSEEPMNLSTESGPQPSSPSSFFVSLSVLACLGSKQLRPPLKHCAFEFPTSLWRSASADTSLRTDSVSFTYPLDSAIYSAPITTHAPFLAPAKRSQMLPPPVFSPRSISSSQKTWDSCWRCPHLIFLALFVMSRSLQPMTKLKHFCRHLSKCCL